MSPSSKGSNYGYVAVGKADVKRATRTRKFFALMSSAFLVLTVVFLVLVEIGTTSDKPLIRDIWFIKLDLSNVVPSDVPDRQMVQTVAKSLGLHDFYQTGLWNYCEGNFGKGITHCSKAKTLYWFNPVRIVMKELLHAATIQLPNRLSTILHVVRAASQFMFGLYLAGACLSFILIFLSPLALYTRWNSLMLTLATLLNALAITAANCIGTALFMIVRDIFLRDQDINIGATVGSCMLAFMWTAGALAILTCIVHFCMLCCCASRRDLKKGKTIVNEKTPYSSGS